MQHGVQPKIITKKRMMIHLIIMCLVPKMLMDIYMREVHELVLFEVEPASTLTGFLKNSILVGRDLSFRQKKWMGHSYPRSNHNFSEISRNRVPGQKTVTR